MKESLISIEWKYMSLWLPRCNRIFVGTAN